MVITYFLIVLVAFILGCVGLLAYWDDVLSQMSDRRAASRRFLVLFATVIVCSLLFPVTCVLAVGYLIFVPSRFLVRTIRIAFSKP